MAAKIDVGNGSLWNGDCLEMMRDIPDGSVDMVLCDLPYGTTACKWDAVIPFEPLWERYWRIAKPNAAIVLTAAQPFTSALVMSQANAYKHHWIWEKEAGTGFQVAKFRPMMKTEDIIAFCKTGTFRTYCPQMVPREKPLVSKGRSSASDSCPLQKHDGVTRVYTHKYPENIIRVNRDRVKIHPTQKPVALFEYLIKTYTNPGDLVLDNCSGSGTTAIAAERSGRRWLCIERDPTYYAASLERIKNHIADTAEVSRQISLMDEIS